MHGSFSEEALEQFAQLAAQTQAADFAEGDTYDFTRCVRPDGTAYGTRGKCRKGSEAGPAEKPAPIGRAAPKSKPSAAVAPKRKLATAAEAKETWAKAEAAAKAARNNYRTVLKETKGDKSPEARKRLSDAAYLLDRAERASAKASEKFGAAARREDYRKMTPEQKREERKWRKHMKEYG
jgi:hypothetical protein